MLYVRSQGSTMPLVQLSSVDIEQKIDGSLTLSFNSLNVSNNPGHEILIEESIVVADDIEYRVKQMEENRQYKSINAVSTFFDLIGTYRHNFANELGSFDDYLKFLFNGTGWNYTTSLVESRFMPEFGNGNVIDLFSRLCDAFQCEFEILPNKRINIQRPLGKDVQFQYRYGHNISALSRVVDTTNLRTAITGFGQNGISFYYQSPHASTFGVIEAEPFVDEKIANVAELQAVLPSKIHSVPNISLEIDSIELTDRDIGDVVWLIYEPLNITLKTRILSVNKTLKRDEIMSYKVVLGNFVPKTASDLFVETMSYIEKENRNMVSTFNNYQKDLRKEMENLMTLGVPEIY